MFSEVSRQLWSLGRLGGLGRDLFPCTYDIHKWKQSRMHKGLQMLWLRFPTLTQALRWPWHERFFASFLHQWTGDPYCCCGQIPLIAIELGQRLQHGQLHQNFVVLMVAAGGFWKLLQELAATSFSLEGKHITWTGVLSFMLSLQEEYAQCLIWPVIIATHPSFSC